MASEEELNPITNEFEGNRLGAIAAGLRGWYEQRKCPSAPRWNRVWGVARKVRGNHTYEPRVSDEELTYFIYEAAQYCFRKFDPNRGKQEASAEDRFVQLFIKKLWGMIADSRRRRAVKRKCKRLDADIHGSQTNIHKAAVLLWIRDAVARLSGGDRELIRRVYWAGQTFSEIAQSLGIGKTTVGERHNRILKKLKTDCVGYLTLFATLTHESWARWLNL